MKHLTVQTEEHKRRLSALHTARHAARINLTPDIIAEVFKLRDSGMYAEHIGKQLGLSEHTTRKILRRHLPALRPGPSEP